MHISMSTDGVKEPLLRQTTGGRRKKVPEVRSWQVVDSTGQVEVVEVGKHAIMNRTGLPARDLRMLDPALSYPSTVLGRERAVVVNLEHIKAIITAHEVLFRNARDPVVTPFVAKLQRIFRRRHAVFESFYEMNKIEIVKTDNEKGNRDEENARSLKLLPFEFVALEACLEAACSSLDNEATSLEQEAYPVLDRIMTSKINESVRQIKSRLGSLIGRVQKVRDELKKLLDDDEDMAEMYLTEKLDNSSASSYVNELDGTNEEVVPPDVDDRSSLVSDNEEHEEIIDEPSLCRMCGCSTRNSTYATTNVKELEMILDVYFVQIEGTLTKLSNLKEYVDDTKKYLNTTMDSKQNHLLQMAVIISTASLLVNAFVVLTGVFGMNISIELFDDKKAGMPEFLWTVGGGFVGCIFLFLAALAWYKHKGLLV